MTTVTRPNIEVPDKPLPAGSVPPASNRPNAGDAPETWHLAPRITARTIAVLLLLSIFLTWSGNRHQLYRLPVLLVQGLGEATGLTKQSEIGPAIRRIASGLIPFRFDDRTDTANIPNFDPKKLPFGTYVKTEPIREYNAMEGKWRIIDTRTFLIDPGGLYQARFCADAGND